LGHIEYPSSADLLFVFAFISFGETIQCIELPNVTANFSRNNKMPHIVDWMSRYLDKMVAYVWICKMYLLFIF